MQHKLRISVSRQPQAGGMVALRNVSVRERLLRFLLGEKRRLTILVPGSTVRDIEIHRIDDDKHHETIPAQNDIND